MIACPSPKCGSPKVEGGYLAALVAVTLGVAVVVSGSLFGLLVAAGGVVWGVIVHRRVAEAEAQLADWETSRVCLACTGTF